MQYVRGETNQVKLQISPYLVYNCNYMMFQNRAWGTKWFYAFITSVEYVNNECALIRFEIDVMQTWFFEAQLKQCYVEREHATSDNPGDSLTVEPIDIGTPVCSGYNMFPMQQVHVVITIADADGEAGQQGTGLYSPLRYVLYPSSDQAGLNSYFNQIVVNNLQDSVVGVTVMPSRFVDAAGDINPNAEIAISKPTEVDGYTPRNKKLLTSPYCYLAVDVLNDANAYRYEYFSGSSASFDLYCYVSPEVQVSCTPVQYNGGAGATEELVVRGFPQIPFIIDSYRAWLAQNATSDLLNVAGGVGGVIGSALTGNIGGAINSAIGIAQQINQSTINATKGDRARGAQAGGLDVSRGLKNIYFKKMSVNQEYAKIIDDFFDMYGYACNRHKVPGIHNRGKWSYVKTRGCSVMGNVPQDDLMKIANIYDAGVRFWTDGEVGNYSRPNPLL